MDDFTSKLEKEMAIHSSLLTWTILWTGGPQSMGSKRVRHDRACTHTKINIGQLDSAIHEGPWSKDVSQEFGGNLPRMLEE